MSEVVDFESVVVPMSAPMWRATRKLRGHTNHGTSRCPQRVDPLQLGFGEATCAPCSSLHSEALLVAHRALAARVRRGKATITDLEGRNGQFPRSWYENWTIDAIRRFAAELDMCTRIDRLPRTPWFARALPDPIDQQLVCDLLYFVRSADRTFGGDVFPAEGWARRYSTAGRPISADEVRRRIARSIDALSHAKPAFVTDNIERPLSRRDPGQEIDDRVFVWDETDAVIDRVDAANESGRELQLASSG